jgi:hypothetical protein
VMNDLISADIVGRTVTCIDEVRSHCKSKDKAKCLNGMLIEYGNDTASHFQPTKYLHNSLGISTTPLRPMTYFANCVLSSWGCARR